MAVADPQSTTFQRSEMWRLLTETGRITWGQQWVSDERLGKNIKRAVIASEDAGFADHSGVDWEAMERAWERNQRAQEQADKRNERALKRNPDKAVAPVSAKVVGASTITQQLAKNLFLSGERTPLRKGQELVLTYALETLLDQAAHPRDLSQPRRVGRRLVRRAGRVALLLPHRRRAARRRRRPRGWR